MPFFKSPKGFASLSSQTKSKKLQIIESCIRALFHEYDPLPIAPTVAKKAYGLCTGEYEDNKMIVKKWVESNTKIRVDWNTVKIVEGKKHHVCDAILQAYWYTENKTE